MQIKLLHFVFCCVVAISMFGVNAAFGLAWNDPGVVPVQNAAGQWIDANTRRYISVTGMPGVTSSATATAAAASSTSATSTPNKYVQGLRDAPKNFKALSTNAKIFRGLGVLGGGIMVYQGTVGSGPHGWADVLSGIMGGLSAGGMVASATGPAAPFVIAGGHWSVV